MGSVSRRDAPVLDVGSTGDVQTQRPGRDTTTIHHHQAANCLHPGGASGFTGLAEPGCAGKGQGKGRWQSCSSYLLNWSLKAKQCLLIYFPFSLWPLILLLIGRKWVGGVMFHFSVQWRTQRFQRITGECGGSNFKKCGGFFFC